MNINKKEKTLQIRKNLGDLKEITAAMKGWLLFILCILLSVRAQNILSVSSFQSCFDVSTTGGSLNCTDSNGLATVLDISLDSSENATTPTDFFVKLTVLPPNENSIQLQTSDTCQIPTSDGQCQTSSYTEIRYSITAPVQQYTLLPTNGRTRNPFTVPYAYLLYWCPQNELIGIANTAVCTLMNVQSVIYSSPDTPDSETIQRTFYNTTLNEQFIRCGNNAPAPLNVSTSSTDMLTYTFVCSGTTIRFVLEFYSLAPMCQVWQVQNPPAVYSVITINATGQGFSQVWNLTSVGQGASAASPLGNILARIQNIESPSGNTGEDISGLIITCTDNDTIPFSMMVPGTTPQTNPWTYKELIDPTFNKTFRLPTPENIAALSGVAQNNSMWMFVNTETSRGYGENCGQMGVAENIYQFPPPALFYTNYAARYRSFDLTYAEILKFSQIMTCVPGFGFPYLGLTTVTPCNAVSQFRLLQDLMNSTGKPIYKIDNLPLLYDPVNENMWITNNTLFVSPPPRGISFEIVTSFAGSFVGVGAKVPTASINTAYSSCYVSTADGGCGASIQSINETNCAIYVTVCNTSPVGFPGFYSLGTTCTSDSGIAPLSSLFNPEISNLGGQNCTMVTIPLLITGVLGTSPTCTVTVYSNAFGIVPQAVKLSTATFTCGVNNATRANPPVPMKYNLSDIPVAYANPTPVPVPQPAGEDKWIIGFTIAMAIIFAGIIILGLFLCVLKCFVH